MECVAECKSRLFLEENNDSEDRVTFVDPYSSCNQCGHCLSICPTDAIIYQSVEKVIKIPKNAMDFNTLFPQLKSDKIDPDTDFPLYSKFKASNIAMAN